VVFDTVRESVASVKQTLGMVPEWVTFRDFSGKKLCYFTSLISDRYALSAIRYGIDTDVLDRSVRFTPGGTPGVSNGDEIYITLPPATQFVAVEITFLDGTKSQRKRFPYRTDR
jgi:hypothetical protein